MREACFFFLSFNRLIILLLVGFWEGLWEEHVAKFTRKQVNQEAVIGGRVCRIDEAEEPSDILWENIDTSILQRCGVVVVGIGVVSTTGMLGSFLIQRHL